MEKAEWVKAKRAVLAVLRVQPAQDLITSLMKPVTEADEEMWEDILEAEELNERQTAAHPRQASQAAQEYKLQDIRRYVLLLHVCVVSAYIPQARLQVRQGYGDPESYRAREAR